MQEENQQNSQTEEETKSEPGFKNAQSPERVVSPANEELEYDESPTRAQFNTQRAQKLKACINRPGNLAGPTQHTPETVRRDRKDPGHIRMSSNPQII